MKTRTTRKLGLLLAAAFGLFASTAMAQPADYTEVPILRSTDTDALWCSPLSGGYDEVPQFRATRREGCVGRVESLKPDLTRERLIFWSAASDCHMQVRVKVFRSDAERRVRVVLNTISGGCRAAGWRAGWIVIEKPPAGYRISVENVKQAHHGRDPNDNQFRFPLPPPVVTKKDVPIRVVDLAGCLPLTGRSQWVISTAEHLASAIAGRGEACGKIIETLKLDLNRETLVGASFDSGYCERPDGLRLSMTMETSTHPRQNAYVLNAIFDDPKTSCETWQTYPVWVVMPKRETGYSFHVHARRASRANEPRVPDEKPIEWIEEK